MASVHDVAAYILKRCGQMTTMKLQKLLYYSQAWSMVWDESPLFSAKVEAWANGPVVPEVYKYHRSVFLVSEWPQGDWHRLSTSEKATVGGVIQYYGSRSPQWLSDLSHKEPPWKNARKGLPEGARGHSPITPEAMGLYYGSL
jgi:uncharacterized phage-associated protein